MFENNDLKINISDFQKVFAVTAVMMQTILTLPYPIPKMKRLQHSSVPFMSW